MATVIENLETARANISARIAEVTASPKPNYSIDGQSVSWESYFKMLTEQLKVINDLLAAEGQDEHAPYELTHRAWT